MVGPISVYFLICLIFTSEFDVDLPERPRNLWLVNKPENENSFVKKWVDALNGWLNR